MGNNLKYKFYKMGVIQGMSQQEIVRQVGLPNSQSILPDNCMLLQWISFDYHISIIFKDDLCLGVSYEYSTNPNESMDSDVSYAGCLSVLFVIVFVLFFIAMIIFG